jgi:hypothetical protein
VIRAASGHRKMVVTEFEQYDEFSWAEAHNEIVELIAGEGVPVTGFSVYGKADTGTGTGSSIALAENSLLARAGSSDVAALTVAENSLVCRQAGGNLATLTLDQDQLVYRTPTGTAINVATPADLRFRTNGSNCGGGYFTVDSSSNIAVGGDGIVQSPLGHAWVDNSGTTPDGAYYVEIDVCTTDQDNTHYTEKWTTLLHVESGDIVAGLTPAAHPNNAGSCSIALSNFSGQLRATLTNDVPSKKLSVKAGFKVNFIGAWPTAPAP